MWPWKAKKLKTTLAINPRPGGVIPIDSLNEQVEMIYTDDLPCPIEMKFTKPCICMSCDFLIKNCAIEILCRQNNCQNAYIGGCTNYKNEKDTYGNEKRTVFKGNNQYQDHIFAVGGKSKKDN